MNKWIDIQKENAFLWVPFLMTAGAAAYFAAPNNVCWVLAAAAFAAGIFGIIKRRHMLTGAGIAVLFGLAYAFCYTHVIDTPQISRPIRGAEISGRVIHVDYTNAAMRAFIKLPAEQIIQNRSDHAVIRINVDPGTEIKPGDDIRATINIFPPAGADAPETFDYARWAYFNGITATGFATKIDVTSTHMGGVSAIRDKLHRAAASPLADTLVLGYKNAIGADEREIWTTVGIGHVWSISGFHMTLVAGWLFAIFYCIFRFIPAITRRVPARIVAMGCAWVGLLTYLFLSGTDVATVRAFLMTTLVFAAFAMGRNAISMRNICIAFCIIFLINPHYVMQPGFQLSFAAIFGLIWFWSNRHMRGRNRFRRILYAIYAAGMTSVVATIFTAPFVAAHFNSMPVYGLVGNLILLPIFSIVIMPAVLIGTITAPFGITFPLHIADAVYNHAFIGATKIAAMPHATLNIPHVPNVAILCCIMGALVVMFIRRDEFARNGFIRNIKYVIGGAFVAIGVIITIIYPRPMFMVTADHQLAGFVYDGKLEFSSARASGHKFAFDAWRTLNHEPTGIKNVRRKPDHGVWIYQTKNFTVAFMTRFVPLHREIVKLCRDEKIDYIVSYFDVIAPRCHAQIIRGGAVIYPSGRVRAIATPRPWNNPRG